MPPPCSEELVQGWAPLTNDFPSWLSRYLCLGKIMRYYLKVRVGRCYDGWRESKLDEARAASAAYPNPPTTWVKNNTRNLSWQTQTLKQIIHPRFNTYHIPYVMVETHTFLWMDIKLTRDWKTYQSFLSRAKGTCVWLKELKEDQSDIYNDRNETE